MNIACEFRYRKNRLDKETIYIFLSQSGETEDTYAALDLCKKKGMKTCAIVNVIERSIAIVSYFVLPIYFWPDIGVASTKSFLAQLLVLYIFTLKLSFLKKNIDEQSYKQKIKDLKNLHSQVEKTLLFENQINSIANIFSDAKRCMCLGRGSSFPSALERALQFKQLSYVHAEGYPAAEMKHGPLALI